MIKTPSLSRVLRYTVLWMVVLTIPGSVGLYYVLKPLLGPVLSFSGGQLFFDSGTHSRPRFVTFRYEIDVINDDCVHRINRAISNTDLSLGYLRMPPVNSLLPGRGPKRTLYDSIVVPDYLPPGNYKFELAVFSDCRWGPTRTAVAEPVPLGIAGPAPQLP